MSESNPKTESSKSESPIATGSTSTGAHEKKPGEEIHSRSADPGQSSYGGFKGEDTTKQAQDQTSSGQKKP